MDRNNSRRATAVLSRPSTDEPVVPTRIRYLRANGVQYYDSRTKTFVNRPFSG